MMQSISAAEAGIPDETHSARAFGCSAPTVTEEGGVYVGVSAGSIIAASNMRSGLQLVNCVLHVHCGAGEQPGEVPLALYPQIRLTNSQALRVAGREAKVIE